MLAKLHGEPLDEAIYCEVMFDRNISGEVPEHREFIYTTAIPALERMGVKVTVLRAEKTYVDLFTGKITRGPKKGLLRAFPICGRCYVQRDCKLKPIQQYQKTFPPDTVKYIGIAKDEQARLLRLGGTKVSLLDKYGYTEQDARSSANRRGSYLLSMSLPTGAGAGSVPMQRGKNCATSMTITRTCGIECWNFRLCPERCLRSSTARSDSPISMPASGWRMNRSNCGRMPRKERELMLI